MSKQRVSTVAAESRKRSAVDDRAEKREREETIVERLLRQLKEKDEEIEALKKKAAEASELFGSEEKRTTIDEEETRDDSNDHETSFCDILYDVHGCGDDENLDGDSSERSKKKSRERTRSEEKRLEWIRLAQETFDKAIRDASVSFRQLRRLDRLESLTNERFQSSSEMIDERMDRVIRAVNERREELKCALEVGRKRQLEAVRRSTLDLRSLHHQCRAAEMSSRRALSTRQFASFLEKRADFVWRSATGDSTRARIASDICRMERKYALCVSFAKDWDMNLVGAIESLGSVTVRGVPPALLAASVHIRYILSLASPSSLADLEERRKWSKSLLLVFEPWLRHMIDDDDLLFRRSAEARHQLQLTNSCGFKKAVVESTTRKTTKKGRIILSSSSASDEDDLEGKSTQSIDVVKEEDNENGEVDFVRTETSRGRRHRSKRTPRRPPPLSSVTERIARDWCWKAYGGKEAEAMAQNLIKTDPALVRSGSLWKAVASGDGHYLRNVMGHVLPGEWFEKGPPRASLLYRASRDGWRVSTFHSMCDGKGPTLTAIKTANGCVFGGYTDVTWDSQGRNTTSSNAWLFSIKSIAGTPPTKMPIKRSARSYATFRAGNYGPTFGGGHDLYVSDNANMCQSSYSNLGHTYTIPPGHGTTGSVKAQTFLAGTYNFTPIELEVYAVSEKLIV